MAPSRKIIDHITEVAVKELYVHPEYKSEENETYER